MKSPSEESLGRVIKWQQTEIYGLMPDLIEIALLLDAVKAEYVPQTLDEKKIDVPEGPKFSEWKGRASLPIIE